MEKDAHRSKKRRTINGSVALPESIRGASAGDVTLAVQKPEQWPLVVAATQGIDLPSEITYRPFTRQRSQPSSTRAVPSADELRLHSTDHSRIEYDGEAEPPTHPSSFLKHYIGIYDPVAGQLEVHEACRLGIRGTVRAREAADREMEMKQNLDQWAQRNQLGQAFGTKKAKKAIAALTENAIRRAGDGTLDKGSNALLDAMQENIKDMPSQQQLTDLAAAAKPRPATNMSAETVHDVYTMDNLIGSGVIQQIPIIDWLEALEQKEEVFTKSRFVAHRLQKVASANLNVPGSEVTKSAKLKMLRYLLALVEIYKASRSVRGGRALPKREVMREVAGMPETIITSIKNKFATGTEMSRFQVDLLLTHICALACNIDNYEVDTYDLGEDLDLDAKSICKYFREIGAKVVPMSESKRKELRLDKAAAGQRKIAKLTLPLEFPKLPYMRK